MNAPREWATTPLSIFTAGCDLRAAADQHDDAIRPLKPSNLAMAKFPVRYDPEADEWQEFIGEVAEALIRLDGTVNRAGEPATDAAD